MRPAARAMMRKEGVNVFLFPCGEAFGAVAQFLDARGRIVAPPTQINRMGHEGSQKAQKPVRRVGRCRLLCHDLLNVPLFQMRDSLVPVFGAEPFEDVPNRAFGGVGHAAVFRAAVVACNQGCDAARQGLFLADLCLVAFHRSRIFGHELRGPGQARKGAAREARTAEIPSRLAVAVYHALAIFRWSSELFHTVNPNRSRLRRRSRDCRSTNGRMPSRLRTDPRRFERRSAWGGASAPLQPSCRKGLCQCRCSPLPHCERGRAWLASAPKPMLDTKSTNSPNLPSGN